MQKRSRPKQQTLKNLKNKPFSEWLKVFNEKHNPHLNTSIGMVNVKTKNNNK